MNEFFSTLYFFKISMFNLMLLSSLLGCLGCFVIWKGMSVVSDTLSHGAFSGLVIANILSLPIPIGAFSFSFITILLLNFIQKKFYQYKTLFLTIWTLVSVTIGSFLLTIYPSSKDFHEFFIGDILFSGFKESLILLFILFFSYIFIFKFWVELKANMIDSDMSKIYFSNSGKIFTILLFIIGVSLSITLQLMGILLSGLFLLIPPVISRFFVEKNPKKMMMFSVLISWLMSLIGWIISIYLDIPVSIGCGLSAIIFIIFTLIVKFLVR